jgi:hypothetical protein
MKRSTFLKLGLASVLAPRIAAGARTQSAVFVCPMHPEVTSTTPGVCPKCNMKLVPKE